MIIHGEHNTVKMSIVLKLFAHLRLTWWVWPHISRCVGEPNRKWGATNSPLLWVSGCCMHGCYAQVPVYCLLEVWGIMRASSLRSLEGKVPGLVRSQERPLCEFWVIPLPQRQSGGVPPTLLQGLILGSWGTCGYGHKCSPWPPLHHSWSLRPWSKRWEV